jgi:6-phosphogluconate dehydrogenase
VVHVGVIGLRGEGAQIVRRLLAAGHPCVVFDESPRLVVELAAECALGAASVRDLAHELDAPRVIVLAGPPSSFDNTIGDLLPWLEPEDTLVVRGIGGNRDRDERLGAAGVHCVDIDTDGDHPALRAWQAVVALIAAPAAVASGESGRGSPRE